MSRRITVCPNLVQCESASTTDIPVTQVALVAVKNAVIKSDHSPDAVATGSMSKTVPAKIIEMNVARMLFAGLAPALIFFIFQISSRI